MEKDTGSRKAEFIHHMASEAEAVSAANVAKPCNGNPHYIIPFIKKTTENQFYFQQIPIGRHFYL